MGNSFELAARNLLYETSHMTVHTNIFVIKVVKHWLEQDTHFDLKQFTTPIMSMFLAAPESKHVILWWKGLQNNKWFSHMKSFCWISTHVIFDLVYLKPDEHTGSKLIQVGRNSSCVTSICEFWLIVRAFIQNCEWNYFTIWAASQLIIALNKKCQLSVVRIQIHKHLNIELSFRT